MSSIFCPPDVVWYNPRAMAISADGLMAYCAGSSVVFFAIENLKLRFEGKLNVGQARCRSITFCPLKLPGVSRFALLLDQSQVMIIDHPSFEVIHSEKFNGEIRTIQFFPDRASHMAVAHTTGELQVFDLLSKTILKICGPKTNVKQRDEELTDMAISDGGLLACGFSRGSVAILEMVGQNIKVVHKQKLNNLVRCLAWDTVGTYLAIVTIDKGVGILSKEGGYVQINLSTKQKTSFIDRKMLSASCSWSRDKLIATNHTGDVFVGDFKAGKDTILEVLPGHVGGKSTCCMVVHGRYVITSGVDRTLTVWDLEDKKMVQCLSTLAGFVYDMAFHPCGTGALALASGDGRVLLAKTDQKDISHVATQLNVKCKLYSLAWHPSNELQIAVGTSNGEVIILDVAPQKNTCKRMRAVGSSVGMGSVCFADLPSISEYPTLLAANGTMAYFSKAKESSLTPLSTIISSVKDHKISCVSFCSETRILLLGTSSGAVLLVCSESLQLLATTKMEREPVLNLLPNETGTHFAVIFGTHNLCIYGLAQVNQSSRGSPEAGDAPACLNPGLKLNSDCGRVSGFCWNPYNEDMFATATTFGHLQVWSLGKAAVTKSCLNAAGNNRIYCIRWSPIDENVVYIGSNGNTLYSCDISAEERSPESDLVPKDKSKEETGKASNSAKSKNAKKTLFPLSSNSDNTSKINGLQDVLQLEQCHQNGDRSALSEKIHMGFFDKNLLLETIEKEVEKHKLKMDIDQALQLMLTGSDVEKAVTWAMDNKLLNTHLVAMSAFVSQEFFRTVSNAYIDSKKDTDIHSVMGMMVACGRREEAIRILCSNNLHREALCIALQEYDSSHPLVKEIYLSWADRYRESGGQYERAARCYQAVGDYAKAVDVLSLYNDAQSAKTAAILAHRYKLQWKDLLDKAIRDALADNNSEVIMAELRDEFDLPVLERLEELTQLVRRYHDTCKQLVANQGDHSDNNINKDSSKEFEELIKKITFQKEDGDLLQPLLSCQPPQNVNQLLAQTSIDLGRILSGQKHIDEEDKLRLVKRFASVEDGKHLQVGVAMFCSTRQQLPDASVTQNGNSDASDGVELVN